MKYIIEKYNFWNISKERLDYLNKNIFNIYFFNNLQRYSDKEYLYRDKIKYKELPKEVRNKEELWYIIKSMRFLIPTIIKSEKWENFRIWKLSFLEEFLHKLDLSLWWDFLWINLTKKERQSFIQNGIMEESISSSQIEWAMTTSAKAKEILRQNKKAVTNDEKMIVNNYKAMVFIKDIFENKSIEEKNKEKISKDFLLELQTILTAWVIENPDFTWRFRKDTDEIIVWSETEIFHIPPRQEFLMQEIESFIKYANDEEENTSFTHPFIKACILHFWIWYLHPFWDWNWRTARAIFYWYLLKKWYWGFSYIPVSNIIKNSKTQYKNAYLYSEQDNFDLTYFIVYLANCTEKATKEYKEKLLNKKEELNSYNLNHLNLNERQEKLLIHFLQKPDTYVTRASHIAYYWISWVTAWNDLKYLVKKWFLESKKVWLNVRYFPVKDFEEKIKTP